MAQQSRAVTKVVSGISTSDGAGVKLKRSLGSRAVDYFDPFLMLDEIRADDSQDYIEGFPDHPHRGFETVTYMLSGAMEHRDHKGNHGLLTPGSVQWMTAGRGIVHSELPLIKEGLLWGFQLWVNLPKSHKMIPPRYQDIPPSNIPVLKKDFGVTVKVLAGEFEDTKGPVQGIVTAPLMLDIILEAEKSAFIPIAATHNSFAYVYHGAAEFGANHQHASSSQLVLTKLPTEGETGLEIKASSNGAKLLLLAARPLNEPVARHGPFVMNTQQEIQEAFADFYSGRLAQ